MSTTSTPAHIKLDERHHVEQPFLDQLAGLGWTTLDLTGAKQKPADTGRDSFTEVLMPKRLRAQLKVINPQALGTNPPLTGCLTRPSGVTPPIRSAPSVQPLSVTRITTACFHNA